jgi:hypothetical protein
VSRLHSATEGQSDRLLASSRTGSPGAPPSPRRIGTSSQSTRSTRRALMPGGCTGTEQARRWRRGRPGTTWSRTSRCECDGCADVFHSANLCVPGLTSSPSVHPMCLGQSSTKQPHPSL